MNDANVDPVLFETALVTAIEAVKESPNRAVIWVGKKKVGVLPLSVIKTLKLEVGTVWSAGVAAKVAQAVCFDEAMADGMNAIDKKAMSEAQLRGKLIERGHEAGIVEAVVARMVELGALDDRALAEALMAEAKKKGGVGPAMMKEKLLKRGITETVVDRLLEADEESGDDALAFATRKLATMKRLDAVTQRRRLWGMLARRGFEEAVVASVVEKLLGLPEESGEVMD